MRYNFCTLFDSYYLTRGIALYNSLNKVCDNFHLYMFAFDTTSYNILKERHLNNTTIIPITDFENLDLLTIKPTRTLAEYCWTCTPSTIWYVIKTYNLDHCVYLDADLFFFSSPRPIFDEIGNSSIGITPHNFSLKYKSLAAYGKFCVQFVFFRNDFYGLKALNWWRESCITWCYARMEGGKYGDQMYLDYFSEKFDNVCEISHQGAGVAPWNVDNYNIQVEDSILNVTLQRGSRKKYPLIFYHYQGLKFTSDMEKVKAEASFLKINKGVLNCVYIPYIKELINIKNHLTGGSDVTDPVVFYRQFKNIFGQFFKTFLKQFVFVQRIYFALKRNPYSQPKGIGADLTSEL